MVSLRLKRIDGPSGLKTHRQNFFLNYVLDVSWLALELKVDCQVSSVLFDHLVVFESKLFAHLRNAHFDDRSSVRRRAYLVFLMMSELTAASVTPSDS